MVTIAAQSHGVPGDHPPTIEEQILSALLDILLELKAIRLGTEMLVEETTGDPHDLMELARESQED